MGDPLFLVQEFTVAPSLTPGPALLHPPEGLCPHRLQGQAQQVSQTNTEQKKGASRENSREVHCKWRAGENWESTINVWFLFLYSQKWNCYFQHRIIMFFLLVPTLIYLWEIYIFPGSVCQFCCREICGLILRIYKSLTDTWLWKFGLRPRNSQKRNTYMGFSLQCGPIWWTADLLTLRRSGSKVQFQLYETSVKIRAHQVVAD